jgi:hypothetical protein
VQHTLNNHVLSYAQVSVLEVVLLLSAPQRC